MTKYVTNEYFLTKMLINKSNMHLFNQDILGIMTLDKDKDIQITPSKNNPRDFWYLWDTEDISVNWEQQHQH